MDLFDHEKLDVYQVAIEWVAFMQDIAEAPPRGASSIALNIAEGAGEFSGAEKARFYRIAKRSATEVRRRVGCGQAPLGHHR